MRAAVRAHLRLGARASVRRAPARRLCAAPAAVPVTAPAATPAAPALPPPPPPKPPGAGARVFDWIIDHPGLFLAAIFGPLFGYIGYSMRDSSARDDAVAEVEAAAPVCARELAAVGRANGVPPSAFLAAADRVLASSGGGDGRATAAEVSLAVREAWRAARGGAAAGGGDDIDVATLPLIVGEHHLVRAAAALAADARAGACALPVAGSAPGAVAADGGLDDAALESPVLPLLSLYGAAMGGRAAPPAGGADDAVAGGGADDRPTPHERLDVWLRLVRAARAGGAPADAPVSGPVTGDEVSALVGLLAASWQVPPRARVRRAADFPLPAFAPRAPADYLAAAEEELKLGDARRTAAAAAAAAGGGEAAGAPGARGAAPPADGPPYTVDELRRLFLRTKAICAWGECFAAGRPG